MKNKKLESLIIKVLVKLISQELQKISQDDLQIIATNINQQADDSSQVSDHQKISTTAEIVNTIYRQSIVNLPVKTEEDAQLETSLREMKFRQELRKDWILFLVKDVIVYSSTVIFIFLFVGFYLFNIISQG